MESIKCRFDHVSVRGSSNEDFYFGNGCSQHMTGERRYTKGLKNYSQSYVTFGDGARRKIKRLGKLVYPSLPSLDEVPLVEGLAVN